MSNANALVIGILIVAALVLDQSINAGQATLFLGRKFFDQIEYLAFWR